MAQSQPMDIRLAGLLKAVVPMMAIVSVAGSLPTWRLLGVSGVISQAVAVCGVMLVMVLNAKLTVIFARRGPRDACIIFMGGSVIRVLACAMVVFLAGWAMDLPVIPLSVWLAITYLLCLIAESIWIVVALKKHVAKYKPQKTVPSVQPKYMDWSI